MRSHSFVFVELSIESHCFLCHDVTPLSLITEINPKKRSILQVFVISQRLDSSHLVQIITQN